MDLNTPNLPDRPCTRIAIDPLNPNLVYVTFAGFSSSNVWRTTDSGITWASVSGNLPVAPVYTLVVDPRITSRLYVGTDADGWGVFKGSGRWAKRQIKVDGGLMEPQQQGTIDPQGCAFDSKGNFIGVDVGHGASSRPDGSIVMFFPGKRKKYDTYCFLDKALAAPSMPVLDDAGNLYVPETARLRVLKFSPPFPTSPADCANPEKLVTTPPTKTVFLPPQTDVLTPSGIARVPGSDHFYIASVLLVRPIINEYDATGTLEPGQPSPAIGDEFRLGDRRRIVFQHDECAWDLSPLFVWLGDHRGSLHR